MSSTFTLQVPAGIKAGACAEETSRYTMSSALAFTRNEQSYVVSGNGKILAALPVTSDPIEKPVLLPPKAVDGNSKGATVSVNGEVRRTVGKKIDVYESAPQEGRYPALDQVFHATRVSALSCR